MKFTVLICGVQAVWCVGTLLYRGDFCAHITVCPRKDNIYLVVSVPVELLPHTNTRYETPLRFMQSHVTGYIILGHNPNTNPPKNQFLFIRPPTPKLRYNNVLMPLDLPVIKPVTWIEACKIIQLSRSVCRSEKLQGRRTYERVCTRNRY